MYKLRKNLFSQFLASYSFAVSESLHRPLFMYVSSLIQAKMTFSHGRQHIMLWGHYHLINVGRVCYRNLTVYNRALRTVDINA